MKLCVVTIVLALCACTQSKPEGEVTTDTTAAAVSGQETTPRTAVTTETTAALQEPPTAPSNPPPTAVPAPAPTTPPAANLLANGKSEPTACDRMDCPKGTRCVLVDVQCIQAPCPPLPECRPEAETSK